MRAVPHLWAGLIAGLATSASATEATATAVVLSANPVISVLDIVPVAVNTATGAILIRLGSSWVQVPQGADAYAMRSQDVLESARRLPGSELRLLRPGMTTAMSMSMGMAAAPPDASANAAAPVRILVEFN